MTETTIEWTRGPNGEQGYSFNPWVGCTKISPACLHCYAESWAKRAGRDFSVPTRTAPANWRQPLKWDREAAAAGQRRRVFCASLADVFDNQVPPAWRADLFAIIRRTPNLDWLLLTKRIGNADRMIKAALFDGDLLTPETMWPWPNVWLGATVVTQEEAERDIPKLLALPARIRFLSIEPMLGPIDLQSLCYESGDQLPEAMRVNDGSCSMDALKGATYWPGSHYVSPTIKRDHQFIDGKLYESQGEYRRIDWVIAGGETGPRPSHPEWFRALRDQCSAAGVPFHFKQWGSWWPISQMPHGVSDMYFDPKYGRPKRDPYDKRPAPHPVETTVLQLDGAQQFAFPPGAMTCFRVGKLVAGRLLDGIEHNDSPRPAR